MPDMKRSPRRGAVVVVLVALGAIGCQDSVATAVKKSDQLLIEAQKAVTAGDKAKALELYDQAIAERPSGYAYLARAQLKLDLDDAAGAQSDVEEGLKLDPEHRDLQWLQGELKKPTKQRFKGPTSAPPSRRK